MQPVDTTVREPPIHRISRSVFRSGRCAIKGGPKKEKGESVGEERSRGIEEGKARKRRKKR